MKVCVFAVKDQYHIMAYVDHPSLMWVKVGENHYYDESNGILRSQCRVHRMIVPQRELDRAGSYRICEKKILERKPYFTETADVCEWEYSFYPVKREGARAYHIADAHQLAEAPLKAAKAYGEIDFLILNGDILRDSQKTENFEVIYEIGAELTKGEKPIVCTRGNHDLRGACAENLAEYIPTDHGKSYYTFRLGSVWGLVLDCGEDKKDSDPEYGHTVCCHEMRKRQTEFIKEIIQRADAEYLCTDVSTKMVIVHNPFTEQLGEPFNIEEKIYKEWAKLLKTYVKPHLMLCGHFHRIQLSYPNDEHDHLGNPSPVLIGAAVNVKEQTFTGTGLEFWKDRILVEFTDSDGSRSETIVIEKERSYF